MKSREMFVCYIAATYNESSNVTMIWYEINILNRLFWFFSNVTNTVTFVCFIFFENHQPAAVLVTMKIIALFIYPELPWTTPFCFVSMRFSLPKFLIIP